MIQMIADKSTFRGRDDEGKEHFLAQLTADTADELAGVTERGNRVFDTHSMALTADGKLLMLDSEGVWHDTEDGSEIEPAEVSGGD